MARKMCVETTEQRKTAQKVFTDRLSRSESALSACASIRAVVRDKAFRRILVKKQGCITITTSDIVGRVAWYLALPVAPTRLRADLSFAYYQLKKGKKDVFWRSFKRS